MIIFAGILLLSPYNSTQMKINIKRVYEAAERTDGYRILVDRIWPRGISKEKAAVDLWLKEIAPSTALRKWFDHDPAKWNEFKKKYFLELKVDNEAVQILKQKAKENNVTLIYAAKDEEHNQAVALKEWLQLKK